MPKARRVGGGGGGSSGGCYSGGVVVIFKDHDRFPVRRRNSLQPIRRLFPIGMTLRQKWVAPGLGSALCTQPIPQMVGE